MSSLIRQRRARLRPFLAQSLLVAWLMGSPARGQEVPAETELLLVRRPGDERVVGRLRTELEQSAWQTIEIGPGEERADAKLAELGRARGARAALRVDAAGTGIELWVASRQDDEQDSVELLSAPGGDERILALRAVEALRARGLILAPLPARPPAAAKPEAARPANPARPALRASANDGAADEGAGDEGAADAGAAGANAADESADEDGEASDEAEVEEPARPPPPPPRLALELLPGMSLSTGGVGPALGGALAVRAALADALSIEALGFVPLWSERLGRQDEGSARAMPYLFAAGVQWAVVRAPFELALIADAGAVLLYTRGEARAPLVSDTDSVVTAAGLLGVSLRLALSAGVRASARAQLGLCLPRVTVRLGTRDAAQFGAPFALLALGLDFSLL